jgi:hypothetical protein
MVQAADADGPVADTLQISCPLDAAPTLMTIPLLNIESAHLVLTVPVDELLPRTDKLVDDLTGALKGEFEGRLEPQVPPGAPAEIPYIMFQKDASNIAFSSIQLDYEVRFRGGHRNSFTDCHDYMAKKSARLLETWMRVGARPVWEGLAVTLKASTFNAPDDLAPLHHISETLLRPELEDDLLHDASVNFGFRIQDRYFATFVVAEYEAKQVERNIAPGAPMTPIRPWDAELSDRGLQLSVEVNNRYGALLEKRHMRVNESDLRAMNDLTWQLVEHVAVPLMRDGVLNTAAIQEVVA